MIARWPAARRLTLGLMSLPLLGLALLAVSDAALSADLDDGPPPAPYARYGSAYDDPRYRDLYGDEEAPPRYAPPRYVEPRYEPRTTERYVAPPPPPYYGSRQDWGSSKDGGYLAPMPPPDRFVAPRRFSSNACVPRHVVKDRLQAQGWGDFHDAELKGDVARVKARRPSGRLFALDIDRCSGEIVDARRVGAHWRGPYVAAPYPPPRRFERLY